jgi:hypothetical protein
MTTTMTTTGLKELVGAGRAMPASVTKAVRHVDEAAARSLQGAMRAPPGADQGHRPHRRAIGVAVKVLQWTNVLGVNDKAIKDLTASSEWYGAIAKDLGTTQTTITAAADATTKSFEPLTLAYGSLAEAAAKTAAAEKKAADDRTYLNHLGEMARYADAARLANEGLARTLAGMPSAPLEDFRLPSTESGQKGLDQFGGGFNGGLAPGMSTVARGAGPARARRGGSGHGPAAAHAAPECGLMQAGRGRRQGFSYQPCCVPFGGGVDLRTRSRTSDSRRPTVSRRSSCSSRTRSAASAIFLIPSFAWISPSAVCLRASNIARKWSVTPLLSFSA